MRVTNEILDNLGRIPVVQNVSAMVRLAHGIQLLVRATFMHLRTRKNKADSDHYKKKITLSLKHMGRALVESIPIISTIGLFFFDMKRSHIGVVSCYNCSENRICQIANEEKMRNNEIIFGPIKKS